MNERIRELAFQASCEILCYDEKGGWELTKKQIELFAELLLKECIEICISVSEQNVSNATEEYNLGREMGATICRNKIQNRFGVDRFGVERNEE